MGIRFANSALRPATAVLGLRQPTGLSNSRGVQIRRLPWKRQGPHGGDLGGLWWSRRDLNPRPCACKAPALPLRHSTLMRLSAVKQFPTTCGNAQIEHGEICIKKTIRMRGSRFALFACIFVRGAHRSVTAVRVARLLVGCARAAWRGSVGCRLVFRTKESPFQKRKWGLKCS